ncbi:MAG: hypothetical protein WBK55_04420 [Alphaproteobacteria bacterium]
MSTEKRLTGPEDNSTGNSGQSFNPGDRVMYHISGSNIFVNAPGNGNTINIGIPGGDKAEETTSQSQPRSEQTVHRAANEGETVEGEIIHPSTEAETGAEHAGTDPEAGAQTQDPGTGHQETEAGADEEMTTGEPEATTEPTAAAAAQSSPRFSSGWKKVAACTGVGASVLALYMMLKSGDTPPPANKAIPEKTAVTTTVNTDPVKAPPAEELPTAPLVAYVSLAPPTPKNTLPTDPAKLLERVMLKYVFTRAGKDDTAIDASAETCAEPWIFKDSRGNEMLCVPLQYLVSLETPQNRKDFLDGAASFKGKKGSVPTQGRFHDGSQILVSRDQLYDQDFAAVIEETLPEMREDAEYHREYAKFTGNKRNATYILYSKEETGGYGYQVYPGIYTLDEAAEGIPERHI